MVNGITGEYRPCSIWRCDGKLAYSKRQALRKAEAATLRAKEWIISYECPDCGKWHIGHADKTQKLVACQLATIEYKKVKKRAINHEITLHTDCVRCQDPIPKERLDLCQLNGTNTLYCSNKCAREAGKERRLLRKEREFSYSEAFKTN